MKTIEKAKLCLKLFSEKDESQNIELLKKNEMKNNKDKIIKK